MNAGTPVDILLVEDRPTDQVMAVEAISLSRLNNRLHLVDHGEMALEFLRKEGIFSAAPPPDLILPDLNMPRKTGLGVLTELKEDER